MEKKRPVKIHTLKTALDRLRNYCAYQERTQQEARDKFYELGLHKSETEQGIVVLIEEGFLNEERYAIAFAGGRFRIKKWGKIKIKAELKSRNISDYCIRKALDQINNTDYMEAIEKVISNKSKMLSGKNILQKKYKIAQYAISRGYEPDLVWDLIKLND